MQAIVWETCVQEEVTLKLWSLTQSLKRSKRNLNKSFKQRVSRVVPGRSRVVSSSPAHHQETEKPSSHLWVNNVQTSKENWDGIWRVGDVWELGEAACTFKENQNEFQKTCQRMKVTGGSCQISEKIRKPIWRKSWSLRTIPVFQLFSLDDSDEHERQSDDYLRVSWKRTCLPARVLVSTDVTPYVHEKPTYYPSSMFKKDQCTSTAATY